MPKFLAIDVGNTRIKVGIYESKQLVHFNIYRKLSTFRVLSLIQKYNIFKTAICMSGELDNSLIDFIKTLTPLTIVTNETTLPISLIYNTPNTLGRDRIAGAVGTWSHFPNQNSLIINMGTCITMDLVSKNAEFLGGNISPGILMRLKAMHKFTARLPLVPVAFNESNIGKNTISAMQNGGVKGAFREIESFIEEIKSQFGQLNVILSGGDAHLFEKYTKNVIFARPYIVLDGLIEILNREC
jgi:type III pantothenate kinase